jgi:hypothetical protein
MFKTLNSGGAAGQQIEWSNRESTTSKPGYYWHVAQGRGLPRRPTMPRLQVQAAKFLRAAAAAAVTPSAGIKTSRSAATCRMAVNLVGSGNRGGTKDDLGAGLIRFLVADGNDDAQPQPEPGPQEASVMVPVRIRYRSTRAMEF